MRALFYLALAVAAHATSLSSEPLDRAFVRLYNFDFDGATKIAEAYSSANPTDPLGPVVQASAILFDELDRLEILEGEFFTEDKRISSKKKIAADPVKREKFYRLVGQAQNDAKLILSSRPNDANAMFALTLAAGLTTDYMALIEKRQLASLSHAKISNSHAQELLRKHPTYADAYLTTGLSEYLLGSLPFFVRWFVKFDGVEGEKDRAVSKLERVIRSGRFLGPFAKILLSVYYLREKKPYQTRTLLGELSRDFPENPLFRKELEKLNLRLR
jgi:hypothetical protein